tara:strand:+ start:135 stop:425 length:291 start_codon:yes stop_codon:yes gene_type:complete
MEFNKKTIRFLKSKAHHLKPIVRIGQKGVNENVLEEINRALTYHELIKVKLVAEKSIRIHFAEKIAEITESELIETIGQIAILYKKNPEKSLLKLP